MGIFSGKFRWSLLICTVFVFYSAGFTFAQENGALSLQEQWRTVFSDQEVVLHLKLSSSQTLSPTGFWILSYNNRTLSQGTFVTGQSAPEGQNAQISVHIPPVKEGVMISAELVIRVPFLNDQENALELKEGVFIFPYDPFAANKESLKEARIGLFDPQEQEKSGRMFEQLGLPFEEQSNMDALPAFDGKMLIVGEGVDFKNSPALWTELLALAERGVPVLILAPQSGEFYLSSAGEKNSQFEKVVLARETVIKEFNKNFDIHWAPEGRTVAIGFKPVAGESDFLFVADSSTDAWPWLELVPASSKAKIILCGFDLSGAMEKSPTPRFLLAEIIHMMIQP